MKHHICNCGNNIPMSMVINGKRRNLKNRTKCLNCLPFLYKPAHDKNAAIMKNRLKAKNWYYEKKGELGTDPILHKRHERKQLMLDLIGSKCQLCGYSRLPLQNLVFHHLDPLKKSYDLSVNQFKHLFMKMKDEFMKCAVFCHNCHGEIHWSNLHSEEKLMQCNELLKSKIIELTDWPVKLQTTMAD
jgi:hypothetical protein